MSGKKRSRWMQRHLKDDYVKKSQKDGYRSRAAYKLLELNEKEKLIRPGMCVVDLGAAPGGWSQVVADLVGDKGRVIALDILPMDSFAQVEFIQGDFREDEVLETLMALLDGQPVDLVICDMAPNISGVRVVDQPRSLYLAELALDFSRNVLRPGGDMLVKVFEGAGLDDFRSDVRQSFTKMLNKKPSASRGESRELYILGKALK